MRTTRRRFVQGTLATTALSGIPGVTRAQPSRARTIRAVMQGDLRSLDPIWTTANITAYHGAMIYDTLFALDGEQRTQPQMVGKFGVSDDKLTHTFELRDGLKFHDGAAVTADDVVASIRRWAARDGGGQHMMARVKDISQKDGEIDFFKIPPIDLLDTLEGDPDIKVEVLNKTGNFGIMRINHLYPPFNNVDARKALLYLINQEEFMKASFGNAKYYRKCGSNFACGTPMENDENTQWFKEAPNLAKAKELFQKSGYDGRPVVLLHATNIDFMNNSAQIMAQRLRDIGVNAQLATSDWGGVITRRAVKAPPDQGGWNLFITWSGSASVGNAIAWVGHQATGEKGWFGWPTDDVHDKLRAKWSAAANIAEQNAVAPEMQKHDWDFVPHVWLGQWQSPVAYRKNLRGVLALPEIVPFWNIEKV